MENTRIVIIILLVFTLYSCQKSSLSPYVEKLIKETYYSETKDSDPFGFKSYEYDNNGRLIQVNDNDRVITEYHYNSQDSITRKIVRTEEGIHLDHWYSYPSVMSKREVQIDDEGDTNYIKELDYYAYNKIHKERYLYRPRRFYGVDDTSFRVVRQKIYSYNNDVIELIEQQVYDYNDGKIADTNFNYHYYNQYGHETGSKSIRDDTISYESEIVNEYQGDLLIETYTVGIEYTYERYEYDYKSRLVRTYNYEDYLTNDRFYENGVLQEEHHYAPDGFDNIPDHKTITVYTYR